MNSWSCSNGITWSGLASSYLPVGNQELDSVMLSSFGSGSNGHDGPFTVVAMEKEISEQTTTVHPIPAPSSRHR